MKFAVTRSNGCSFSPQNTIRNALHKLAWSDKKVARPKNKRQIYESCLACLFYLPQWPFMSAYLHRQPSLRAVFFRLQVVLHEQDCIQIKTIVQWPVFELQSTKNIFEDTLKNIRKTHHLNFTSFTTCRAIIFVLFAFISPKWKPYAFTELSLGSKLRISPEISVFVSISSPRSEAMNWSNNGCSGQWPRLTTNKAQSITVSEKGSLTIQQMLTFKTQHYNYSQSVILCSCTYKLLHWGRICTRYMLNLNNSQLR